MQAWNNGRSWVGSSGRSIRLCGILFALCLPGHVQGAESDTTPQPIRVIKTRNFLVRTDLDAISAAQYVDRMESTLRDARGYWKRPLRGQVECYLVDELAKWSRDALPFEHARMILERIGGGTIVNQEKPSRRAMPLSTIYATTRPGVVEHEVIHAYCFQTFGTGGPDWYREGIAELLAGNAAAKVDASCRDETLKILRQGKPLSLRTILSSGRFTDPIAKSIVRDRGGDSVVGFDVANPWNADDDRSLSTAKVAYAQSWALCYLLHHNPTYAQRFRVYGQQVLAGGDVDFAEMFGPVMRNIDFELKMLGANIGNGYRADLCRWPWMKQFKPMTVGRTLKLSLDARAGFQASRIRVSRGEHYSVRVSGKWFVAKDSGQVTADGTTSGHGRIEAVVMKDFELSSRQQFGQKSTYCVPQDGNLFLRCHDDWQQLSDNRGSVDVRLTRVK